MEDDDPKNFTLNYTGTMTLKPCFGSTKQFVQRSTDGEYGDFGNMNNVKNFCSNLNQGDSLKHCIVSHDLKDIHMIEISAMLKQRSFSERWLYLLTNIAKIPLHLLSVNIKLIPICIVLSMISSVDMDFMHWYSRWILMTINFGTIIFQSAMQLVLVIRVSSGS